MNIPEELKKLYAKSKEKDRLWSWTSEPETSQLLASLIRITGAKTVLEVGVFKGFTALHMVDALPAGGKYIGIDIEDHLDKDIKKMLHSSGKEIELIIGNSHNVLPLITETVDLCFIDGEHDFNHLVKEFKLCEEFIKEGGIIAIHDTMLIAEVARFVPWIKQFRHFDIITLPTPDIDGRGGASGITVVKCYQGR